MSPTYSVAQAQSSLSSLIRKAEQGEPVRILRHDAIVAYLVSRQRMEAIVETLELLSNPAAVKAIGEHKEGKTKFASLSVLGNNEK